MLQPNLNSLTNAQRLLFEELNVTPKYFVLHGESAIALHLGHRPINGFDFFCKECFSPDRLFKEVPYLQNANVSLALENKLRCFLKHQNENIELGFYGNLKLNRILNPHFLEENQIKIASLLDLAAIRMKRIQDFSFTNDFHDIDAILSNGLTLNTALGAAQAIFGPTFLPHLSLNAIKFFFEQDEAIKFPFEAKQRMLLAVQESQLLKLPHFETYLGICE